MKNFIKFLHSADNFSLRGQPDKLLRLKIHKICLTLKKFSVTPSMMSVEACYMSLTIATCLNKNLNLSLRSLGLESIDVTWSWALVL